MVMLTDLAAACRKSGLKVTEVTGWKTRTTARGGLSGRPRGILVHHTATSSKARGNYPTLNVVKVGHGQLRGPLAQRGEQVLDGRERAAAVAGGHAAHVGQYMSAAEDRRLSKSQDIHGPRKNNRE